MAINNQDLHHIKQTHDILKEVYDENIQNFRVILWYKMCMYTVPKKYV